MGGAFVGEAGGGAGGVAARRRSTVQLARRRTANALEALAAAAVAAAAERAIVAATFAGRAADFLLGAGVGEAAALAVSQAGAASGHAAVVRLSRARGIVCRIHNNEAALLVVGALRARGLAGGLAQQASAVTDVVASVGCLAAREPADSAGETLLHAATREDGLGARP